jgi:beta-lactam-binding protein with PASTA domain
VSTSLLGRPASVVRRELRGLGLVVRVQPRPDEQAAPGSVVRIYPTGQVRVGSVVQLTAATRPAPSAPASTLPASTPPASSTPAPSASPSTTSTTSSSPGRAKHSKGPPPGHG